MSLIFRDVRFIRLLGLAVLTVLTLSGCRRHSLSEHAVHESLAEKREQYQTEIERGVQSAPPPIEVPTTQQPPANNPQNQPPQGGSVPPYEAPPPAASNAPMPNTAPAQPSNTRVGDVQLDPSTGQYGIAPPGAPEGYTIPLDNPASNPSSK